MQLARTVGASLGVAAAIAATTLFTATPASAHTPTFSAVCDKATEKVTLEIKALSYNGPAENFIRITEGDREVLPKTKFGEGITRTVTTEDPAVDHTYKFEVKAHNDRNNPNWSKTETLETVACKKVEQPPVEQPPVEQPPVVQPPVEQPPAESSSAAPTTTVETTTSTAVVAGADTDDDALANTGASIAIPLVIGLVLLGGGAAVLIFLRRRARA